MAVRTVKRGTGITRREVLNLAGDPQDIRDTLRVWIDNAHFEARIEGAELWARDVLTKEGLEPSGKAQITFDDSNQQTQAYYAQYILALINSIRHEIAAGDTRQVAYEAVTLGYLICECEMKLNLEKIAVIGHKSKSGWEKSVKRNRDRADMNGRVRSRNKKIYRDASLELDIRRATNASRATLKNVLNDHKSRHNLSISGMYDAYNDGKKSVESS
jgi:hypothetical protein